MAIPTSACARAGGVVHAVADHGDLSALRLQLLHPGRFVLGAHTGEEPVDAEFRGDGSGDGFGIAGDHDDLNIPVMQW